MARKTTSKALTTTEIATLMSCKAGSAVSRLVALGYTDVCSRCGGSGRYSWNQTDGDRCFGCHGKGKKLAKITKEIVEKALERIAAGELEAYFAEHKAAREIKAANDALWAAYMGSPISKAYTDASNECSRLATLRARRGLECYGEGNDIFAIAEGRAQTLQNDLMDRASTALYDKKATHLERIATIRTVHEMVLALNRAWAAFAG